MRSAIRGECLGRPIPYFEHMFPLARRPWNNRNAKHLHTRMGTQSNASGETFALADFDFYCTLGCGPSPHPLLPATVLLTLWLGVCRPKLQLQRWTIHPSSSVSHGLQFDFTYTFPTPSIWIPTRSVPAICTARRLQHGGCFSNSSTPSSSTTVESPTSIPATLSTVIGSIQLPFGGGQRSSLGTATSWIDLRFGWQLSGLARWTSGSAILSSLNRLGYQLGRRELYRGHRRRQHGSSPRAGFSADLR